MDPNPKVTEWQILSDEGEWLNENADAIEDWKSRGYKVRALYSKPPVDEIIINKILELFNRHSPLRIGFCAFQDGTFEVFVTNRETGEEWSFKDKWNDEKQLEKMRQVFIDCVIVKGYCDENYRRKNG